MNVWGYVPRGTSIRVKVQQIYPITRCFEIMKYDDKYAITIANLFENMWLTRYPWPAEITYNQVSEVIGHEFQNSLIQK